MLEACIAHFNSEFISLIDNSRLAYLYAFRSYTRKGKVT